MYDNMPPWAIVTQDNKFLNSSLLNKVEHLQKLALRLLHNGYISSYEELLEKLGKSAVNISNYHSLCIESFKILNDINLCFTKYIFRLWMTNRLTREKHKLKSKLNLEIPKSNQVRFGTKSLRYLGVKV